MATNRYLNIKIRGKFRTNVRFLNHKMIYLSFFLNNFFALFIEK
jgi:hypothetical protein